ncbi:hypothetical protein [Mycobacteroides abscessus]|uniref:hypothetical protein n=1 Tax=Mycobacteroides abscessus TaxID=36809 RepID=UPI0011C46D33|nr:hypothetical protein [Mycobacteroides abscessus]
MTDNTTPGNVGELHARSVAFGDTGYSAIVSQTCDISGAPGLRHPFVQVCPVRDVSAFPQQRIEQIRNLQSPEYFWLTNPPEAGAQWAVDLRVSVPVSKGVLVTVDPIEGFTSPEGGLQLGQRIASKLARPAIHDALAGEVFTSLRSFLSRSKKTQNWCDDIEQLRLEITDGIALQPRRVRLLVLTDRTLTWTECRPLREEWKSHKKTLQNSGIEWAPISFLQIDKCTVWRYRNSVPIDIPTLSRGRFV